MAQKIQIRRDTAANWTSVNPTLAEGEIGYEKDTGGLKFGDGATAWTSLLYAPLKVSTLIALGLASLTTPAESWIGPSNVNGVYFKGAKRGFGTNDPQVSNDVRGIARIGDGVTNYQQFETGGHQSMQGTARPWRDELGSLILAKTIGTRIVDNATEGTADYSQTADINEWKFCNVQLNHDRDFGSVLSPHIHWIQTSASVPNWLLQYRWQVMGQAEVTSWTSVICRTNAFTYTSGTIIQISETVADITPPGGAGLSDIVQFRIIRDNANGSGLFPGADPLAATVSALFFDVHFLLNSQGSTLEFTK